MGPNSCTATDRVAMPPWLDLHSPVHVNIAYRVKMEVHAPGSCLPHGTSWQQKPHFELLLHPPSVYTWRPAASTVHCHIKQGPACPVGCQLDSTLAHFKFAWIQHSQTQNFYFQRLLAHSAYNEPMVSSLNGFLFNPESDVYKKKQLNESDCGLHTWTLDRTSTFFGFVLFHLVSSRCFTSAAVISQLLELLLKETRYKRGGQGLKIRKKTLPTEF